MEIKIIIEGPGSSGELIQEVSNEQKEFLMKLAERWNNTNLFYAQPYVKIEDVK